jgi:predicted RND superfamily exporter protein
MSTSPLERYARFLVRHAWLVILAVALVTAVFANGMRRLYLEIDIEAVLPANHPFVQIDRQIRREFGGRNTMVVAIVPREGQVWRPEILELVHRLTLDALKLPGIIAPNVVSLASPSVRRAEDHGGTISVEYLMKEAPKTPEEVKALRARVDDDPQLKGMLVTPDNRAALLFVDFWPDLKRDDAYANTLAMVDPYRSQPVDFYFAGEPMFTMVDLEQSLEIAHRIPLTFLVITAMLLFSFRSIQGMLVPMLTATLSSIWGLGLMGYSGIVVDGWNIAVPILLIAVAAAHSAQMLKRYGEEVARTGDNRTAVIVSTVAMGPVMVAAGMTAALGFASLALFGVRSIANFGLSCVRHRERGAPRDDLHPGAPLAAARAAAHPLRARAHPALPRPAARRHHPRARLPRARRHGDRARRRLRRHPRHPHLRLDARVPAQGRHDARAPRGDREALPGHDHHDDPLRGPSRQRAHARAHPPPGRPPGLHRA